MVEELNGMKEGGELIVLKFCKILIREIFCQLQEEGEERVMREVICLMKDVWFNTNRRSILL